MNHYKKLCTGIVLVGTMNLAVAAPVACISGKELTGLTNQYKELPYVRGISSEGTSVVVFVNPATGSFTIAERRGVDTFCALAVGASFAPVPKDIQDDIREEQDKGTL